MMNRGDRWRIWSAEAAGTGLFVLGALSAVALVLGDGSPADGLLDSQSGRMLVTGLLVGGVVSLIVLSPLGRLSGAHLNPVVTLAFTLLGRVSAPDVFGYMFAQTAGALAGGVAFRLAWGGVAESVDGGVTHPTVATLAALGLEAGMAALLVAAILLFVSRESLVRWIPLMLWLLIGAMIWTGGAYTGTSLNPARSIGPAVAFADFTDLWLYLVAPTLGALAVAALWRRRHPSAHPRTARLSWASTSS
jgi:aquaporin Z